jgi:hypothetical protein
VPVVLNAQNNLKTTIVQRYLNGVRRNLETAADAMPEAKYGFNLTAGQMSFAEWVNHSTERNYSDCATLKPEPHFGSRCAGRGALPGWLGRQLRLFADPPGIVDQPYQLEEDRFQR